MPELCVCFGGGGGGDEMQSGRQRLQMQVCLNSIQLCQGEESVVVVVVAIMLLIARGGAAESGQTSRVDWDGCLEDNDSTHHA